MTGIIIIGIISVLVIAYGNEPMQYCAIIAFLCYAFPAFIAPAVVLFVLYHYFK